MAASFGLQATGCERLVTSCEFPTTTSNATIDNEQNLELPMVFSTQASLQLEACSLMQFLHPVHISVTEINYSEKDKALQIVSRLFIDDLELSIRAKRKDPDLDLMEPKAPLTTKQLMIEYLTEHFKVTLDGKLCKLNFLGVEKEDLSLICYIEIANVKKIKTLEVFNDAIMGTHEDQSNLVHVTFKSPVKSARLVYNKPSEKFVFDKK
jgi:hypothetical protein